MEPGVKAVDTNEDAADEAAAPPTAVHSFAEKIGSRNLMIAIVTMPFIFIGALALIIAIVGLPEEEAPASPDAFLDDAIGAAPVAAAPVAAAPEVATVEAPAEAVIRPPAPASSSAMPVPTRMIPPGGIALDGNSLAVRIERADGDVIVIYDLARGEVVNEVPLSELAGTTQP